MTDAEKAYAAAEAEIKRVRRARETKLDLHGEAYRALAQLPQSIADLDHLVTLYLNHTQVSDLTPLGALTALEELSLDGTQVSDMRPLRRLEKLGDASGGHIGLHFENTTATRLDAELARMSEIEDDGARGREVLEYLATLPPSPSVGEPPEQDDALVVGVTPDGLDVATGAASVEEAADTVRHACLTRLRPAADNLARAAGNMHGRLADRARDLSARLKGDLADLNLLEAHLDLDGLRDIYDRRDERIGDDTLSADEVDALSDITRYGPGLVRGNGDVEKMIERLAGPSPETTEARDEAINALATSLHDQEDWVSAHMREFLGRALIGDGAWGLTKRILTRNTGIAVTAAIAAGSVVLGGVSIDYAKAAVVWSLENWRFIVVVIGEQYATWLPMVHEAALQWLRQNGYRDLAAKYLNPKD